MRLMNSASRWAALDTCRASDATGHWYNYCMDESTGANSRLVENIKTAFGLQRFGLEMMRQNFVRRFPDESSAQIDARLARQLLHRPEAEHGDGVGVPGTWPRHRP